MSNIDELVEEMRKLTKRRIERMGTTPGGHDDMVDAVHYGLASRQHTVVRYYSWKHIVAFVFFNLVLGVLYFLAPSTRVIIFFYLLGSCSALTFRPWQKRWKYTMLPAEYPNIFKDEPTTIHNKRI
jgi:hypothetical protein